MGAGGSDRNDNKRRETWRRRQDKVQVIIIIKHAADDNIRIVVGAIASPAAAPRGSVAYLLQIILTRQCRCISHDDGLRYKYLQILQAVD